MEDDVKNSNEIVEKYKETVAKHKPQLDECLRMAASALADAERIANEHGIPFRSPVSRLRQSFMPDNMPDLDNEKIEEITGTWVNSDNSGGWEQSQLC